MTARQRPPAEPPSAAAAELAAWVRAAAFPRVRYQHGYDRGDVDHLLRGVAEALERGTATAQLAREVARSAFHATVVRSGYDERSVDDFLDTLAERLGELLGEPPAEGPSLLHRVVGRAFAALPFVRR